jgi:anhydro-N-acetylmuramic acid kinase
VKHLAGLARKKKLRVAGLMSGTSADGVDVAIVDLAGASAALVAFATYPYPANIRSQVLESSGGGGSVADLCHLNFALGEIFAAAVIRLCRESGVPLDSIDLVGSHGQTVCHLPKGRRFGGKVLRSTLQTGEPSVIAERTGITTVADFRPRDIAAGGQGAPLVPLADYLLFGDAHLTRAVQNIGGIANVTFMPAGCSRARVSAFDTGPGNMLMDALVGLATGGKRRFDRNGATAARGSVDGRLLAALMRHPFLAKKPPKTTGREDFGAAFAESVFKKAQRRRMSTADMLATAAAYTAESIAAAYVKFLPCRPDEVILCGGGARNQTLVQMLRERVAPTVLRTTDDFGIDADAKEAVSFAILAAETIRGNPGNVPSATGAGHAAVLGKVVQA